MAPETPYALPGCWLAASVASSGRRRRQHSWPIDAVKQGDRAAVQDARSAQRADVNAAEADGMTALHWAVRAADVPTAQLLIRAGAKVNAASRYGVTPIMLAAQNGDPVLVDALLKAGADANSALPEGETALMTAARTGKCRRHQGAGRAAAPRSTPRKAGRGRRR